MNMGSTQTLTQKLIILAGVRRRNALLAPVFSLAGNLP